MRDWRETVAPGAPTVKLDIGSRRGQKNSQHTGTSTMQHQGYYRALTCADLTFLTCPVNLIFRDFYFLMKLRTTILLHRSSKGVSTCSSHGDLAYTPSRRGKNILMSARDVDAARLPNFFLAKTPLHSSWKAVKNDSKNTYLLELPLNLFAPSFLVRK